MKRFGTEERGSGLPLIGLSLAFLLVMVSILTMIAGRIVDRTQAQSAADAAALAGLADGEAGARLLAAENGARLLSFSTSGNEVEVVVELAGVRAIADAERSLVIDPSR